MGMNITQKILSAHLVEGTIGKGNEIGIRIDQTLTQDATGTMAYLQFEAMGIDRKKNELAVSYVDHNTVQVGFENADDHQYLQSTAAKYGAVFSRPGNGICHQLHLERFGKPGKTLLGSDSHTPTGGGIGMMAMGAGGIDVAVAMGGGTFYLTSPKIVNIYLEGELRPWVSAKDVILYVLKKFGTKGNVGTVFEYSGPGLSALQVPDRATITNMGAECGVTTSLFPSDENTRKFLGAQGREADWTQLLADEDAQYDDQVRINLSELIPLTAEPHSPGNIAEIASLAGKRVDQVLIGSCTNSSYRDLRTAAEILDGKTVFPGVSLGVAPGSREVMLMLAKEGYLEKLIAAGARILESACGFCIGNHMSPGTDAVSLRTSNRNFEGRSGTKSAQVYLVSPEVAALAAIKGEFVDPMQLSSHDYPKVDMPESFIIDDSMFVFPPEDGSDVEIIRGPNIGAPPLNTPIQGDLNGVASIKVGDKITTDHIMPAGSRLKYRSNVPAYSQYVFEPVDPDFPGRAAAGRDAGKHNIIIAGSSYGQGSSREHAALCPMYLGVKAVVAVSIERIHTANLFNFGIIPFTFANPEDYALIEEGDILTVTNVSGAIETSAENGKPVIMVNETKNREIPLLADFTSRQRSILQAGGLLAYTTKLSKK
ncbi:MAG: aconitate hydratase [Bacteroidetes bacterium]|nr:aconitate hydratase [Bacteroidota bacterium]